jgi:hypothetical protein
MAGYPMHRQTLASDHTGSGRRRRATRHIFDTGSGGATARKITPLREGDTSTIQAAADALLDIAPAGRR